VVPIEAEETIETVLAPPSASRLLGSDATTPMLLLTRSSRDADGRPVEYVRSLYRGDRFRLTAQLTRERIDTQGEQPAAAVSSR
jgi:GntR family transcriptional regulator